MSILGSLGSLVVSLETNIAQYVAGLSEAEQLSRNAGKAIEQNLNSANDAVIAKLKVVAGAAAAALSVGAFAAHTAEVIHATAAYDDMAERTGIAVEELSRMGQVAKVGGHELGNVEAAAARLVKGLSATDDETKGVGKALEALGVSGRDAHGNIRPLGQLLPEIAGKLSTYADSSSKTAIAQDLFGRSGREILPFLKDYVEMSGMAAAITGEQAAAAERLEKSWKLMQLQTQNIVTAWVNQAIPTLQSVVDIMSTASLQSDSLKSSLARLGQDGSVASWAEDTALFVAKIVDWFKTLAATLSAIGSSFKVVGADIAVALAAGASMGNASNPLLQSALQMRNEILQDASKKWQALLERDTSATEKALADQIRINNLVQQARMGAFDDQVSRAQSRLGNRTLNYGVVDTEAIKRAQAEVEKLRKILESINAKDLGLDADYYEKVWFLNEQFMKGRIKTLDELRVAVQKLTDQQPFVKRAAEANNKVFDEEFEAIEKVRLAIEHRIKAAREMTEGLELELASMKMTNSEREIAIALRKLENDGVLKGTEAYEAFARRIRSAVEAKEGLKDQIDLFKSIESVAHDVWTHIGADGENVFKQLGRTLKSAILDLLYQLTVKAWIINIGANMSGMSPAAFAAQMGTSYLGGSGLSGGGGLGGMAASYMGANEFYTGLSTGAQVYAPGTMGYYGALANTNLSGMGFGSAAGGAGIAGLAGGLVGYFGSGALGAGARGQQVGGISGASLAIIGGAIFGPIGAAIGAILGAVIGKFTDPDGLAERSATFGQLHPGQRVAYGAHSAFGDFGFADTHWFSDNEMQAPMQAFLTLQAGVDNMVYRLANADQRAAIQTALQNSTRSYDFGTEHGDFSAQLATVARDRLEIEIGALYPSLQAFIHNFEGSLDDLYAYVSDFLSFRGLIADLTRNGGVLGVAQTAFQHAQSQWLYSFNSGTDAMLEQLNVFDGSRAATDALVQSTGRYVDAMVQLLEQIETVRASIAEMFGNTSRNIQLSGMTDQERYDFYQQEAESLYRQLMSSSDPQEIQRLAARLNDDINAAFGLLSPEEQAAHAGDFLERLSRLTADVDDRLRDIETTTANSVQNVLDRVSAALDKAAEDNQTAANTQLNAANTNLTAANTPRVVIIETPTGGQVATFEGGD
jgi:hypothetical protein